MTEDLGHNNVTVMRILLNVKKKKVLSALILSAGMLAIKYWNFNHLAAEAGDKVKTINKENQNTDKKVDGHHQKKEVAQDFKEEERTELVNPTDTVDAVQSYAEDQEKIEVCPSQTKRSKQFCTIWILLLLASTAVVVSSDMI